MEASQFSAVSLHLLPGNQAIIRSVVAIVPQDQRDGDAEFFRQRAISATVRMLRRGNPLMRVYVSAA